MEPTNVKGDYLQTNRTPSNIMIKSSFPLFQSKEPSYITETIKELYFYISNVSPAELESVELEAKFGLFEFKGSCVQGFKEVNDIFKIPSYNRADKSYSFFKYDFKSGLSENMYYTLWFFVNEESKKKGSEIVAIEPINYKETHYRSGMRRSIVYKNGTPLSEDLIHKKDKQHINIRNSGRDFRITICREEKQKKIAFDDVPTNYREKFRVSYKFRFCRLDFTTVVSYKDPDADSPKEVSYEVEFEFDELSAFIKKESKSPSEVRTMLLRFIQNIFCISELANSEYLEGKCNSYRQNVKGSSIFGDYLEKNLPNDNLANNK